MLKDANFVAMSHADIEQAHRARRAMRVNVTASLDDFRDIRFFHRGHHSETIETRHWLGLRKSKHEVTLYDDVVLFVAAKPAAEITSRGERKLLARRKVRPGSVLIKYFRNISGTDLNGLFPNVRVVMSPFDALAIGLPAVAGAIPILLNLASTVTVLFLVIGFYLGIVAAVEHDELKRGFAAMSGLAALIGFVTRQWLRYQRQSLKYQKELTDNVYYRNINNNAGIFDYLIASAEDQECKEAFLAYYFLTSGTTTQPELERRIESWLRQAFAVDVDFNIGEALAKLERFGLIERSGERLAVPSPDETLGRLHRVWRDFFAEKAASPIIAGGAA